MRVESNSGDTHLITQIVPDWKDFLRDAPSEEQLDAIRGGERTGRPLGSSSFIARLERRLKRPLARQKPGPKPKKEAA